MYPALEKTSLRVGIFLALGAMFVMGASQLASATTLCVNPSGSHGCYSTIQAAVNHAAANDVINVAAGTYNEEVDIGIPLSLIGAGANKAVIEASRSRPWHLCGWLRQSWPERRDHCRLHGAKRLI